MLAKRIIPCLDIKEGRVVKGTSFVGLRDAGDPVELAARYNQQSADELIFLDISASKENRGTTIDLASRLARELFIPFTIGGGISSLDDIQSLVTAGADKISINSSALSNPGLITDGARRFGHSVLLLPSTRSVYRMKILHLGKSIVMEEAGELVLTPSTGPRKLKNVVREKSF